MVSPSSSAPPEGLHSPSQLAVSCPNRSVLTPLAEKGSSRKPGFRQSCRAFLLSCVLQGNHVCARQDSNLRPSLFVVRIRVFTVVCDCCKTAYLSQLVVSGVCSCSPG